MRTLPDDTRAPGREFAAREAPRPFGPVSAGLRGPLPIVIGVTGHRDIAAADVPALEERIGAIFAELARTYRHTPLLLLSPLASGADRIAARVAMSPTFGIPVIVPLPFERGEYERDFDAAERAEFDALLGAAFWAHFVGYAPGNDALRIGGDAQARDRQYARAGAYVARHCQLLIALWNGLDSDAVGGTAQIVKLKRAGDWHTFGGEPGPVAPVENGRIYHIVTPRLSEPGIAGGDRFEIVTLEPVFDRAAPSEGRRPRPAAVIEATYRRVDRFNRDAVRLGMTGRSLNADTLRTAFDALAAKYRDGTNRAILAIFACALAAAAAFEWYVDAQTRTLVLLIYLLACGVAFVFYRIALGRELQSRYQDYRAIAEGLRVQEFWRRAALREAVADHYLRSQRGELDWIRDAIRACRMLEERTECDTPGDHAAVKARLSTVCADWIDGPNGQIAYFTKRIARYETLDRRCGRSSFVLLCASFALVALLVLADAAARIAPGASDAFAPGTPLWHSTIIAICLSAVGSALVQSYARIHAFSEHVAQYGRIRDVYAEAAAALRASLNRAEFTPADETRAREILRDLGAEALAEHAAWVMLHRERPLEYVHGG